MERDKLIKYITNPTIISAEEKKEEILKYCIDKGKDESLSQKFIQAILVIDSVNPFKSLLNEVFVRMLEMRSKELGLNILTHQNNQIIKIF